MLTCMYFVSHKWIQSRSLSASTPFFTPSFFPAPCFSPPHYLSHAQPHAAPGGTVKSQKLQRQRPECEPPSVTRGTLVL